MKESNFWTKQRGVKISYDTQEIISLGILGALFAIPVFVLPIVILWVLLNVFLTYMRVC